MKLEIQHLSFFVIRSEDGDSASTKTYKHYQTLTGEEYEESALKPFLDGEFGRICKRKAERHPSSDNVPTKIGHFVTEPGYDLGSNADYALLERLRTAADAEQFLGCADEMLRMYMQTNAVRGGAFIVSTATPVRVTDTPLVFVMKCDFESKIARISDEQRLIAEVEMAISARSIKSIQYPHMPEEGMLEERELKIHQASHARYFEDFLRHVAYEKPLPELVTDQVYEMVQHYVEEKWEQAPAEQAEAGKKEELERFEVWAASENRELQEHWTPDNVAQAAALLTEHQPELEFRCKLGGVEIRAKLADYGRTYHLAKHNGRYVFVIEGDGFAFERGVSPVELLLPEGLQDVMQRLGAPLEEA
ncbi:DUF3900 domain-containing protein [Paenibacillus sp. IB182496]|uniref:DUF3900 domain-containing protein n=1 Tax=Paenibacillus sabuli TaxID=2772509 RepID=A0A927BVQ0_9BACL|nr:DUF3900 domain-containing protein [Paenibacillus sabuli]MBD2846771.1 DUF3900 domain-containing protein [Paenibacillus sabuli]